MASAASSNPYIFQRASTMATRALVSDNKPNEISSSSSNDSSPHFSHFQDKTSKNYEQAATAATKACQLPATTASSAAASVNDRPGLQRQQSWRMSDLKGRQQGQMLAEKAGGPGFSSTQK